MLVQVYRARNGTLCTFFAITLQLMSRLKQAIVGSNHHAAHHCHITCRRSCSTRSSASTSHIFASSWLMFAGDRCIVMHRAVFVTRGTPACSIFIVVFLQITRPLLRRECPDVTPGQLPAASDNPRRSKDDVACAICIILSRVVRSITFCYKYERTKNKTRLRFARCHTQKGLRVVCLGLHCPVLRLLCDRNCLLQNIRVDTGQYRLHYFWRH
jgi:hypothetical protein